MYGKYASGRVMRIKSTTTKAPKTAQRLKIDTSADGEDYDIAHGFVRALIVDRRLPLKETTVSYLVSRGVHSYRSSGMPGLVETVDNALFTILHGIDDGSRAKLYNVCKCAEVKNPDILFVLRAYFHGFWPIEDSPVRLQTDGIHYFVFIPSMFDLSVVRGKVESILRGNSL